MIRLDIPGWTRSADLKWEVTGDSRDTVTLSAGTKKLVLDPAMVSWAERDPRRLELMIREWLTNG